MVLKTDSKTVHAWLESCLRNACRVKVSGLQKVLVECRLQIITDLVAVSNLFVTVEWVPSHQNKADKLTRVPEPFLHTYKMLEDARSQTTASANVSAPVVAPRQDCVTILTKPEVIAEQHADSSLSRICDYLEHGTPISDPLFSRIASQLFIYEDDGMLMRSLKLPVDGIINVPVVPSSLQQRVLHCAHEATSHGNWESMWKLLRKEVYFPGMASACHQLVEECTKCAAASSQRGESVAPVRPDIPSAPWEVVSIDTLHLGLNRSGRYKGVLVCVNHFSK